MKTIVLSLVCLLFSAAEIRAQEAPKDLKSLPILPLPLPPGDLISQAPDPAQWIISSVSAAADATPGGADTAGATAPKPSVVSITKSGKLYLVESANPDGKKIVRWKDHQFQATYMPGATSPSIADGPGSSTYIDFTKSDFPEFSWISAHNYVGMTKLGATVTGLVFKASVPTRDARMGLLSGAHRTPADAIAVVDMTTRKPLMLQVDNEILLYQFNAGGADVSLPPEVQQAFNSLRKQIQRASLVPTG